MTIRRKLKISSKDMQIFWRNVMAVYTRYNNSNSVKTSLGICSAISQIESFMNVKSIFFQAVYNAYPEYTRGQINTWLEDENEYIAVYTKFSKKVKSILQIAATANGATMLGIDDYWWDTTLRRSPSNADCAALDPRLKTIRDMLRYHQLNEQDFCF